MSNYLKPKSNNACVYLKYFLQFKDLKINFTMNWFNASLQPKQLEIFLELYARTLLSSYILFFIQETLWQNGSEIFEWVFLKWRITTEPHFCVGVSILLCGTKAKHTQTTTHDRTHSTTTNCTSRPISQIPEYPKNHIRSCTPSPFHLWKSYLIYFVPNLGIMTECGFCISLSDYTCAILSRDQNFNFSVLQIVLFFFYSLFRAECINKAQYSTVALILFFFKESLLEKVKNIVFINIIPTPLKILLEMYDTTFTFQVKFSIHPSQLSSS